MVRKSRAAQIVRAVYTSTSVTFISAIHTSVSFISTVHTSVTYMSVVHTSVSPLSRSHFFQVR